jgi:ribonucleoside-diphosphate reductase alpha chain
MLKNRPLAVPGVTYQLKCGCGPIYITCTDNDNELFEVFVTIGKAGGCGCANKESLGKVISIALRSGTDPAKIAKSLDGVSCPQTNEALGVYSCITCIAKTIQEHEDSKKDAK